MTPEEAMAAIEWMLDNPPVDEAWAEEQRIRQANAWKPDGWIGPAYGKRDPAQARMFD